MGIANDCSKIPKTVFHIFMLNLAGIGQAGSLTPRGDCYSLF
jgi:hypothetical protein